MSKTSHFIIVGFCLLMTILSCESPTQSTEETQPKWQSLFNGEDQSGWVLKVNGFDPGENFNNTVQVEDGLLKITYDEYEDYGEKYGVLFYDKAFTNYRLRVEYRFVGDTAKGAPSWGFRDSGIVFHSQSPQSMAKNQPFPVCLEYNLLGGDGINERPSGQICALGTTIRVNGAHNTEFCTQPDVKKTFHGDQWVTAEIEVRGDSISQYVNGEKILTFTDPSYDLDNETFQPYMPDTTITASNNVLRSGYIGFQSNSHPIQFRKVEILELN